MFKMFDQQEAAEGEVRDAKNNERHACGRRRDGEAAVSPVEHPVSSERARTQLTDIFNILAVIFGGFQT